MTMLGFSLVWLGLVWFGLFHCLKIMEGRRETPSGKKQ